MHSTQPQSHVGSPGLLVVSLAATMFVVLAIALVAVTGAGWAIGTALLAHALATAAVVASVMSMLSNAD
jgi:hypothetical protein